MNLMVAGTMKGLQRLHIFIYGPCKDYTGTEDQGDKERDSVLA
jgi:hypothetical protein